MFPKLKISKFLLERLEKIKQQCSGCLFGVFYGDHTLLLLSFNIESTIGKLNYKETQHKFPTDVDLCGLVKFGDCSDAEAHLNEILKDVDITDNPILLQCKLGTLVDLKASIFLHGKLTPLPYGVMEEAELYQDFYFSRLRFHLDLYTEEDVKSFKYDMQQLRKSLVYGRLAFQVNNAKVFLTGGPNGVAQTLPLQTRICDLANLENKTGGGDPTESSVQINRKKSAAKKKQNGILTQYEIINVEVLKNKSKQFSSEKQLPSTSMQINRNEKKILIPLEIDTISILYRNTKLIGLYDILIESICRSLRLIEQSITENFRKPTEKQMSLTRPKLYHFSPPNFGHLLTLVYLENTLEDEITNQQSRKKLHHHLGLPTNRPYFRRANKFLFIEEVPTTPLLNVHECLKQSNLNNANFNLVHGRYSYFHYMQDKIDDKGWGCAYRSLQTLFSWFIWQGYSDKKVPSHNEIQKYLVKIGDKPSSFVGSCQWIGSTEVALCLQGFLGVNSKIIHCKNGSELTDKGPELVVHFQSQGTPIMIGGGVLAHTIIGVDYDDITGSLKFLILDPHFTGSDDINVILGKGWCGWKGTSFWNENSYYNLCMPQKPTFY